MKALAGDGLDAAGGKEILGPGRSPRVGGKIAEAHQKHLWALARAGEMGIGGLTQLLEGLGQALDEILGVPGHVFAVLDVAPLGRRPPSPPLDGPELKFRFPRETFISSSANSRSRRT